MVTGCPMSEQSRSGPGRFQTSAPVSGSGTGSGSDAGGSGSASAGGLGCRFRFGCLLLLGCAHRLLAGCEFGLLRGQLLVHFGLFRRDLVQVGSDLSSSASLAALGSTVTVGAGVGSPVLPAARAAAACPADADAEQERQDTD